MEKKSSTERVRAFRQRMRANKPPKKSPASSLERSRKYRAKKRALKLYGGSHNLPTTLDESISSLSEDTVVPQSSLARTGGSCGPPFGALFSHLTFGCGVAGTGADMESDFACRLCGQIDGSQPLVDLLRLKIKECFGITVTHDDGMSQKICFKCKVIANEFHSVMMKYQTTQRAIVAEHFKSMGQEWKPLIFPQKDTISPLVPEQIVLLNPPVDPPPSPPVVKTEPVPERTDTVPVEFVTVPDSNDQFTEVTVNPIKDETPDEDEVPLVKITAENRTPAPTANAVMRGTSYSWQLEYNCTLCDRGYPTVYKLKTHITKAHRTLVDFYNMHAKPFRLAIPKISNTPVPPKKVDFTVNPGWMHFDEKTIRRSDPRVPHCFISRIRHERRLPGETPHPPVLPCNDASLPSRAPICNVKTHDDDNISDEDSISITVDSPGIDVYENPVGSPPITDSELMKCEKTYGKPETPLTTAEQTLADHENLLIECDQDKNNFGDANSASCEVYEDEPFDPKTCTIRAHEISAIVSKCFKGLTGREKQVVYQEIMHPKKNLNEQFLERIQKEPINILWTPLHKGSKIPILCKAPKTFENLNLMTGFHLYNSKAESRKESTPAAQTSLKLNVRNISRETELKLPKSQTDIHNDNLKKLPNIIEIDIPMDNSRQPQNVGSNNPDFKDELVCHETLPTHVPFNQTFAPPTYDQFLFMKSLHKSEESNDASRGTKRKISVKTNGPQKKKAVDNKNVLPKIISTFTLPTTSSDGDQSQESSVFQDPKISTSTANGNGSAVISRPMIKCKPTELLMASPTPRVVVSPDSVGNSFLQIPSLCYINNAGMPETSTATNNLQPMLFSNSATPLNNENLRNSNILVSAPQNTSSNSSFQTEADKLTSDMPVIEYPVNVYSAPSPTGAGQSSHSDTPINFSSKDLFLNKLREALEKNGVELFTHREYYGGKQINDVKEGENIKVLVKFQLQLQVRLKFKPEAFKFIISMDREGAFILDVRSLQSHISVDINSWNSLCQVSMFRAFQRKYVLNAISIVANAWPHTNSKKLNSFLVTLADLTL